MFIIIPEWAYPILLSSHVLSMTVNALVTGLIVFRIFKVFRQVKVALKPNLALNDAPGSTLGSIIFIVIESGMALFSIQLVRLVVYSMQTPPAYAAYLLVVPIHEMLNVIIRSVITTILILLIMWIWLGYNTYTHSGAGLNGVVFQRPGIRGS